MTGEDHAAISPNGYLMNPIQQMIGTLRASILEAMLCCSFVIAGNCAVGQDSHFEVGIGPAGVTSLKFEGDDTELELIRDGASLGDLIINYRVDGGDWKEFVTALAAAKGKVESSHRSATSYTLSHLIGSKDRPDLKLLEEFEWDHDGLIWRIKITNISDTPIEIGDIALPEVINTRGSTYQTRLNMHRLIAGHGSFVYWVRADGSGDRLVMTPLAGTALEYMDRDRIAFIHSAFSGAGEQRGTWRKEHTSVTLGPEETVSYGFRFQRAQDYSGVRDTLYEQGLFDIHIVPGMVVPTDLQATFSLRTKNVLDSNSVQAEFPSETHLDYLGERKPDIHIYRVRFERLGENLLTVNYGNDEKLILEWFVTLPLETVFKKRAAFITSNQQYRDRTKWYDGLFSLWDMRNQVLRGPEDRDGLQMYMVGGSDDPSNSKCAYLAEKNVGHPNPKEIEALEYFVENFVWGKLQRTDSELPHPYGIYGSENWYLNRNAEWGTTKPSTIEHLKNRYGKVEGTGLGKERLWRTFDYTTYILLYYNLYQIAKQNPDKVRYLDAAGYLERAFGTAKAYFEVPYSIYMPGPPLWSHKGFSDWAYKQGNFHEKYLVNLIAALEVEGRQADADFLRNEWEKKVKYFIYDDPHPYKSEMHFDRTAFESTHAVSRYALEHELKPDENLWYDKNLKKWYSHPSVSRENARAFMEKQLATNIALRGWLETAYFSLGSARSGRGTHLCYMSQMGGWSILDYALYYAENPAEYLRLGYASILSSWALVNCGTAESKFGYWYPGEGNDGAAGWNFQVEKFGNTWMRKDLSRGPWFYDGEIDHGLAGGINAACTVVVDDPLFGIIAYGGSLTTSDDKLQVVSRDGLGQRFHMITEDIRFHMILARDGIASDKPIVCDRDLRQLEFSVENRSGTAHIAKAYLAGVPDGNCEVWVDGAHQSTPESEPDGEVVISIPLAENSQAASIKITFGE